MRMNDINETRLLEIQQRKEVNRIIVMKVEEILRMPEDSRVGWGGSKADLLEMLQIAYTYGGLTAADGSMLTLQSMVRRSFTLFHLTVMKNVSAHARRAMDRKGRRVASVACRVRNVMHDEGKMRDMWREMIHTDIH